MVRVKKRYVLLEIVLDDPRYKSADLELPFEEGDIVVALREAVQTLHGDFGLSSVLGSLFCKRLSKKTRCCLFSSRFGPHYLVTTAIPFVRKIKGIQCSLRQLYISGTIRGSLKFLKEYYEKQMIDYKLELKKFESHVKYRKEDD